MLAAQCQLAIVLANIWRTNPHYVGMVDWASNVLIAGWSLPSLFAFTFARLLIVMGMNWKLVISSLPFLSLI
jgi:hypothetical protein